MAIEVFNRYEKKYLIDEATMKYLLEGMKPYVEADKFCKNGQLYNIANIYFDTPTDALIRASIEKPVYKEKLRLRSYGVPGLEDEVFLEIKKKYNGMVNKRRTRLKLKEAYALVNEGKEPEDSEHINKQVLEEIKYFLKSYDLQPKVYLTYDRMAFFSTVDKDFRITFDTNIKTRRVDVGLEKGQQGELLIGNDMWLMEVKSHEAVPMWFTELLSKRGIKPTSFSKYGTEYKKNILLENKGVNYLCLNQLYQKQEVQQYQPRVQLSA